MAPGHPLPSSPRGWSWLPARPRRSCFLVARRLCFGDTRVFRSPERVERSQSLHCSRVTAGPAASAGARALPQGPATARPHRLAPGGLARTLRPKAECDRDTVYLSHRRLRREEGAWGSAHSGLIARDPPLRPGGPEVV